MMRKHTGLGIIIGGLVIVVLLAAYASYKSYTNIGVGDDPKVQTSVKTPTVHKQKTDSRPHKPRKKDSNIFLQDTNNPDRIIAINPYGSDGVYLYRKQANGDIYPEYKYFNGKTNISGNKLTVSSKEASSKNSNFSFELSNNGTYRDTNTGDHYQPIAAGKDQNSRPASKPLYINGQQMRPNETIAEFVTRASKYASNPSYDASSDVAYNDNYHDFIKLKNNNYYDTIFKKIYGENASQVDLNDFSNHPEKYVDPNFDITQDAMYYKQNGQTQVSDDSAEEYYQWEHQITGTGLREDLMPEFSSQHQPTFDDTKPTNTAETSASDQVNSTDGVSDLVNDNM